MAALDLLTELLRVVRGVDDLDPAEQMPVHNGFGKEGIPLFYGLNDQAMLGCPVPPALYTG